jgi:WD40 repeat protein
MTAHLTSTQIKKYAARLKGEQARPIVPIYWQQKRAIQKLAKDGSAESIQAMSLAVADRFPLPLGLRRYLITSLSSFRNTQQLQLISETATSVWPKLISYELFGILKDNGFIPSKPPRVRVAVALICGWPELLADDGSDVVPTLLEALSTESCMTMAEAAVASLRIGAAVDTICRHWMENGESNDSLYYVLKNAGHAPMEPVDRALFWMLCDQHRYEELDLDGSLLVKGQAIATSRVRKRLATAAAKSGRIEWIRALQEIKTVDEFSNDDWSTTVEVLLRAGNADEIWKWAFKAPPIHSQRMLLSAIDKPVPQGNSIVAMNNLLRMAQVLPHVPPESNLPPDYSSHTLKEQKHGVELMSWSADGCCLAASSKSGDNCIRLYDSFTGSCTSLLSGHRSSICVIIWSPSGHILASCSWDQTVRLWNPSSGECTHILEGHTGSVYSIAWSPDGRFIASCSSDKTIRLWDPASGNCIRTMQGFSGKVRSIAWSPNGHCIASAGDFTMIYLWDPQSGVCTKTFDGHWRNVRSIVWAPHGKLLASFSKGNDRAIRIWDPVTGNCIHSLKGHESDSGRAAVRSIAWSPNGRYLASSGFDKSIRLWDPITGNCLNALRGHRLGVHSVTWSPNGCLLASSSYDTTIRLWDPTSGECSHILKGHAKDILSIAWSPNGNRLASGSRDKTIKLWENCLTVSLRDPISKYTLNRWNLLASYLNKIGDRASWMFAWLEFIAALGTVIRCFDVNVDDVATQPAASPFEVEIDG